MEQFELEIEEKNNKEYLVSILDTFGGSQRKSKKILGVIVIICAIALFFMFSELFDGVWGYILTIAILGAGVYCLDSSGILSKISSVSEGKLAYQACVTMEILIAIKNGTYRQYGSHIITTGVGKHIDLYKRFIQVYPEYAERKELEKLSKIKVELTDI